MVLAFGALKLYLLQRAYGFERGDAVEYVNIAVQIDRGMVGEWWSIRPLLMPALLLPTVWLGSALPDPDGELTVRLVRSVPLVFSLGTLALTYYLGRTLEGTRTALIAVAILGSNWLFNYLSVNPYTEVPATFFVTLAIAALVGIRGTRGWLIAGLALGLASITRYQSLIFLAPLGIWALRLRAFRRGFVAAVAVLAGIGAQGLVDVVVSGRPFQSFITSFDWMLLSNKAAEAYGAQPPYWFVLELPALLSPPGIVLATLGLALAIRRWQTAWLLVALGIILPFAQVSAITHKELRFLTQLQPLISLVMATGTVAIATWVARRSVLPALRIADGLTIVLVGWGLVATIGVDLVHNPGYVDGLKIVRARASAPDASTEAVQLATVPWDVCLVYAGDQVSIVRGDPDSWQDRAYVDRVTQEATYFLIRRSQLEANAEVAELIRARYRTVATFPDGLVLLERATTSGGPSPNT